MKTFHASSVALLTLLQYAFLHMKSKEIQALYVMVDCCVSIRLTCCIYSFFPSNTCSHTAFTAGSEWALCCKKKNTRVAGLVAQHQCLGQLINCLNGI